MRSALRYGILLGLALFGLTLVIHAAGFNATPERLQMARQMESLGGFMLLMVALVAGLRSLQKATPAEPMGFGRALKTGTVIALVGGVLGGLGIWLYGTAINPDYAATLRAALLAGHEFTAEEVALAERQLDHMTSPLMLGAVQAATIAFFGAIMSMAVAVFFRRRAA